MKKQILFVSMALTLAVIETRAQNMEWGKGWGGGPDNDYGYSVFVDPAGNAYSTGQFAGTVDFDPGPSILNLTASGIQDVFVSKLNSAGNLDWAIQLAGTNVAEGNSIAVDPSGNIYVAGAFTGTVDFDPGPGIFNLISNGLKDIFICKLNSTGTLIWAKQIGDLGDDRAIALALDVDGNAYTTGLYSQVVDFDPGPSIFNLTSVGPTSIFISMLDASGNFGWAKSIEGATNGPSSITLDVSKNIYITGYFTGPTDFDLGAGSSYLISAGFMDVYVAKYDSACNLYWARGLGGPSDDFGTSVKIDASGNVYTGGKFSGPADFDPGVGTFNLASGPGFISKLDSAGNFVWAKEIGGVINSIDLDFSGSGAVYSTGQFSGTADFDPDTGIFNLTPSLTINRELFISKLDTSGHFRLVKQTGLGAEAFAVSIDVDASGHAFVLGFFIGPVISFDTMTYTNNGSFDVFLAKMNCSDESFVTATACNYYTSPSGNFVWSQSGKYIDTKANPGSCDSVFVVSLTMNRPDTTVTQSGIQLTANAAGATYQWIDCNNGFSLIAGETNPVYTATANGSYAVLVTKNGCTDTSACYPVTGVGVDEIHGLKNDISIYPNPAENETVIHSAQSLIEKIEIHNLIGQRVLALQPGKGSGKQVILNTTQIAPGMYYLTVYSNTGISTYKLVRK